MTLANLSTTLTDVGIAVEALLLCGRLSKSDQISVRCWAIAFSCTAIAAASGSLYHGFFSVLSSSIMTLLHAITAYTIGIASAMMLVGVVKSSIAPAMHPWLIGGIGLKFGIYVSLQGQRYSNFAYVVADYLSAMAIILILEIRESMIRQTLSAIWLTLGIVVSMLAASLLALHWSPQPTTSPEAVYHIVQMGALYCLFQGSQLLIDRKSE